MADCIGKGFLQFPCALVQIRYSIGENVCGHILKGDLWRKESELKTKRDKKRKWENGGGGMQKAIAIQVEPRIKIVLWKKFNIFTCRIILPEINLWFY